MANEQNPPRLTVDEVADILQRGADPYLSHQFLLARDTHSQDPREITVPFLAYVKNGVKIPGTLSSVPPVIAVITSYENLAKHLQSGDIYNVEASRSASLQD